MKIEGTGDLQVNGEVLGKARYEILITTRLGVRSADGRIYAKPDHMIRAFEAGESNLVRDDNGFAMKIIVRRYQGGESADIAVNGTPGPI